ncbi:MAG: chromosome partitioning protein ParA, partial [Subtercola sp.]|nr:chromosome partitioning protein ParA [Subtercola sp.]
MAIDRSQALDEPVITALLRPNHTGVLNVNGASRALRGTSEGEALQALIGLIQDEALKFRRPVRVTVRARTGLSILLAAPDGSIEEESFVPFEDLPQPWPPPESESVPESVPESESEPEPESEPEQSNPEEAEPEPVPASSRGPAALTIDEDVDDDADDELDYDDPAFGSPVSAAPVAAASRDTETAAEVSAGHESEPEPNPEPEAEPQAELEAEPESDAKPEPEAESQAEPEPEPMPKHESEPTPEAEPEPAAELRADAASTPELAAQGAAEATSAHQPAPEIASRPESEPRASTTPPASPATSIAPKEPMSEQARRDLLDAPSFLATTSVDEPAQHGFAGFMNRFGFHLAPGPAELSERNDIQGVSRHFDAHRTISVINRKGGANKTPTVVNLAAVFARYGGGGVLAWDNNETMGTLGWRTEPGAHGSTVLDVLGSADELLDARAEFGQMSGFVHHQQADKFDVLRSDEDATGIHEMTADEVDVVHSIAAKYYRLIFMDSGNSDRAENWLRMIDHTDQLVVPTTTMEDRAQAALLTLQAVQSRSEKA